MLDTGERKVIGGKYRLERPLARGGMGSVWVARHLQLDLEVAVKFIGSDIAADEVARTRFEREAKISAHIQSPHVVHVHDYGIEDDTPYIAMELLKGEDLEARLSRKLHVSVHELSPVVSQVCKALRRAHEAGLIHRDLKPGNIFISRQDEEELVKVLDFGIAKSTGPLLVGDATRTGSIVGSPHYMSPEQTRSGRPIDHRADLWSLGVVIFQCLTGRLPFPGASLGDLLVDIAVGDIPIPSSIVPELGPDVDLFIARALQRDPEARFQSAREMAEAFAVVAGARPPLPSLGFDATVPAGERMLDEDIESRIEEEAARRSRIELTRLESSAKEPDSPPLPGPARPSELSALTARTPGEGSARRRLLVGLVGLVAAALLAAAAWLVFAGTAFG